MTYELQLRDYESGYRFRVKCPHCGYEWHEQPSDLLARQGIRKTMYLEEVEARMHCRACRKTGGKITPIIVMGQHHFIGGLA